VFKISSKSVKNWPRYSQSKPRRQKFVLPTLAAARYFFRFPHFAYPPSDTLKTRKQTFINFNIGIQSSKVAAFFTDSDRWWDIFVNKQPWLFTVYLQKYLFSCCLCNNRSFSHHHIIKVKKNSWHSHHHWNFRNSPLCKM
jgi:hypothetical protein